MTKVLCGGTGSLPVETRTLTWTAYDNMRDVMGKCGTCGRVLTPKKDGRLRQHQARGRTTRTMDKTMDGIWQMMTDAAEEAKQ